ncbi:helix-turn-helix domain-containing protein, partial [Glutamicibacter soli]
MTTQPHGPGSIPEIQLHHRLRIAREFAGFDQVEFAAKTGISRATISAAENGHRRPIRSTVKLWALATGVNTIWLETGNIPAGNDGGDGDGGMVNIR